MSEHTEPGSEWAHHYKLPPPMNMMEKRPQREKLFVLQGTRMFSATEACILKYLPGCEIEQLDILDFGCGVGRVALPFFFKYGKPSVCADVDAAVIQYLRDVIPAANPIKTDYSPPLPFADSSFDCIYAISVWTHLPPTAAEAWLHEVTRLLRPKGVAMLTTASYSALTTRRQRAPGWQTVSDDDLRREGMIFKPTPSPRGVTGTYGMAVHDAEWIRRNWSKYMPVVGVEVGGILGRQDINVLQKP